MRHWLSPAAAACTVLLSDLRAVAPDHLRAESNNDNDNDEDDDDMDDESASNVSYDQVCSQEVGRRAWEIHTVLI